MAKEKEDAHVCIGQQCYHPQPNEPLRIGTAPLSYDIGCRVKDEDIILITIPLPPPGVPNRNGDVIDYSSLPAIPLTISDMTEEQQSLLRRMMAADECITASLLHLPIKGFDDNGR